MKLALFLPSLAGGGAERVMLNLAGGFLERGHGVDLVLARREGPLLRQVPEGAGLVDLRARKPLGAVPRLAAYLRRERPDALFSTMTHANIAARMACLLSRTGVPCLLREASALSRELAAARRLDRWLVPRLVRLLYPGAAAVVALSRGVADDLCRVTGLRRERVQVIYNPVVSPALLRSSREPVDHPWLRQPVPVILAVGRLTRQKDFPTLLQAFALLRARREARLLILGEGEERPALEALCRELEIAEAVDLPGFVDNPRPFMAAASLMVLSSRWEGLGNVLIEALACGTPVVATDCPEGPREVLGDGAYGQLVPVGDAEALARAMERVLDGSFRPADVGSWLERFGLDANVERFLALAAGGGRAS